MCRCDHPTRNDEQRGWNVAAFAPPVEEDDELIYDECGRCSPQVNGTGNTDYHSHHLRLVSHYGQYFLLVRHGGGDERIPAGYDYTRLVELLQPMDSDRRYLMLHALYSIYRDARRQGKAQERARWQTAAAEKRIKTRRLPKRGITKVWIEN